MRVFLSGTYRDLVEYRQSVIEQLNRMRIEGVKMEFFGANDLPPTPLSLKELDSCDVYLGIIGHRYGSLSPDNARSVTHREYDHAYQRLQEGKIRLLIYLADDSVPLLRNLLERDELRAKQNDFRQLLEGRHTVQYFRSPADLASRIAADLHWLDAAVGSHDSEPINIFDADQIEVLERNFDTIADERLDKIEGFIQFVAESFHGLFDLDRRKLDTHPFFQSLRERLRSIIPGVYLDDAGGILQRTGVRHVVMRAETLRLLLQGLDDSHLYSRGREIGIGAAGDLIEHTIKRRKLLPSSGDALVMLWGYWDRTGGWGKITPLNPNSPKPFATEPGDPILFIKIENNFLQGPTLEETHKFSSFWCGYIHGFFEAALPQMADLMADLSGPNSSSVTLPAYHSVASVTHVMDDVVSEDIFCVQFQPELLSNALATLRESRWPLKEGNFYRSMRMCKMAIIYAKQVMGEKFDAGLNDLELEPASADALRQILRDEPPIAQGEEVARRWLEVANSVINHLSRSGR